MFRSTSKQLLRLSSPWSFIKIHQPLPLSNTESRHLLNILTTSFRRHLDREHGILRHDSGSEINNSSTSHSRRASTPSTPSIRTRPTDLHLSSILANPLFALSSTKSLSSSCKAKQLPMDVFDEACARGLMTTKYAHGCLDAHKKSLQHSPVESVSKAMRDSEAGSKVLRWLSSNGLVNTSLFLDNSNLTTLLIEYLVAENSTDIVWDWVTDAFGLYIKSNRGGQDSSSSLQLATCLLTALVKAQAKCSSTLDKSYITLDKSARYLQQKLKENGMNASDLCSALLSRAGCWLSWETTIRSSHHLPANSKCYDLFMKSLSLFTKNAQHLAHLALHHPTTPNADAALSYLHEQDSSTRRNESRQVHGKSTKYIRDVAIGLDAAKVLLEQSKSNEAKWVMNYLSAAYPFELGIHTSLAHDFALAKAEADTLELLSGLDLAY